MRNDSKTEHHIALSKYEFDDFKWGICEDNVPEELLSERERSWIAKYSPKHNLYNETTGGDGRSKFSDEEKRTMLNMWKQEHSCRYIAGCFDTRETTVSLILQSIGVTSEEIQNRNKRAVAEICPSSRKIIRKFESCRAAARAKDFANSNIVECCQGQNITAGGSHWRYVDSISDDELAKGYVDYVPTNRFKGISFTATDVSTGQNLHFDSVSEAYSLLGGNRTRMTKAIDSGKPYRGYLFRSVA